MALTEFVAIFKPGNFSTAVNPQKVMNENLNQITEYLKDRDTYSFEERAFLRKLLRKDIKCAETPFNVLTDSI